MIKVSDTVRTYNWHVWWSTWIACNRDPTVMTVIEWDINGGLFVINRQGQKHAAEAWAAKPESVRNGTVYRTYRAATNGMARRRGSKASAKDHHNSTRAEFACTCNQASHT